MTERRTKCPICAKPAAADHRPFCSPRCAERDLHRWFTDQYRVPTEEPVGEDGEGDAAVDAAADGEAGTGAREASKT